MTTSAAPLPKPRRPWTRGRIATHAFLAFMTILWLIPLVYAVLASLRDYQYTAEHGYLSFGGFTLNNYVTAWQVGEFALPRAREGHDAGIYP